MYRLRLHRHLLLLCAALLAAAAIALPVLANEAPLPHVAVIYPQVREPYRAVFRSISEGIAAASARSAVHELAPGEDLSAIERQLAGQPLDAVILLGKRGLDLSAQLGNNTRRIVGAVFAQPGEIAPGVSVISLAPAPRMLFARLRELAPAVQRIHVIHGVDVNDWLIERAKQDAAAAGYELVAQRMDSIRDGANAYRELLPRMRSPQDALWLLQASPFLDEASVLQMVLRAAWDRNLVIFSSNPSHVPKGALFALFPNDNELGRRLAREAAAAPTPAARLQPLEQLHTAINIRTADHLGLGLDARDPRFDMVFPSRL